MSLLGIHLTIWAGPAVPVPLAPSLLESIQSLEVTHTDSGRSGFQIVFRAGRGPTDLVDFPAALSPQLRPMTRVLIMVAFGVAPAMLMDGLITNQQLGASGQPGSSTFTVTGEDISFAMDRREKTVEHPALHDGAIAMRILAEYAQYGVIPMIIPPPTLDLPLPTDRIPVQQGTDLRYLQTLAARYNYVFYVTAGPAPMTNTAYFGPPVRVGPPQRALTYNMGPATNVASLDFEHAATTSERVEGRVQDRSSDQDVPVVAVAPTQPPLATSPPSPDAAATRVLRTSGVSATQAFARAQGMVDSSINDVVTVTGSLDALRYGEVLRARAVVGLRGAGFAYDGLYYVKSVTHKLTRESYAQEFTLAREGLGSLTPVLPA